MNFSESKSSQSQNWTTSISENYSMVQNIQLMPCDIHGEWGNSLSEICIKKDCKKIFNISCNDCIRKEHSDQKHTLDDVINLKKFISQLNILSKSNPNSQQYNDILKPSLEQLNKQAKELLIKIDQLRAQAQEMIETIVKLVTEEQDYTKEQQRDLEIIRTQQNQFYELTNRNNIDEYLKKMNQLVNVIKASDGEFSLELKCKDYQNKQTQEKISQSQQRCDKSAQKFIEINAQITDIINQLNIDHLILSDTIFQPILEFSETLKHPSLRLINKNIIEQTQKDQSAFCLVQSQLPANQDSTWAFKINSLNTGNIMIGVAHPDIIKQSNFTYPSWNELNQGYYCLYGHGQGQTFTHWKKEENNITCNLGFQKNDIIYILLQPQKKKIYFCKNKTKPCASITLSPDREDYQPCVALYEEYDQVQILKNDQYYFDL